jgi:hypothetical protein
MVDDRLWDWGCKCGRPGGFNELARVNLDDLE